MFKTGTVNESTATCSKCAKTGIFAESREIGAVRKTVDLRILGHQLFLDPITR
jgi:hypothetical protein